MSANPVPPCVHARNGVCTIGRRMPLDCHGCRAYDPLVETDTATQSATQRYHIDRPGDLVPRQSDPPITAGREQPASGAHWHISDRLAEPSTWAGLTGFALLLGISETDWALYSQALAALCAAAAVFLRERRP